MFWLEEGLPASLVGGTRPRTTLSPSLALRDGEGWMSFGTPGGDQQDQWSLLFFLSVVDHGLNLQEAIDAPAFHSAHFPSSFYPRGSLPGRVEIEGRWPEAVHRRAARPRPRRRGHGRLVARPPQRRSRATRTACCAPGANPRGMQGYAVGR